MLESCINFLCSIIMSLYGYYAIKKITTNTQVKLKIENIILIILLSAITTFLNSNEYQAIYSVTIFILNIIIYKIIFKIKIEESTIVSGIVMLITTLGDAIIAIIFRQFFSISEIRSTWYLYMSTTIMVTLIGIITLKIGKIEKQLKKFYKTISTKKSVTNTIFLILLIIGISSLTDKTTNSNIINGEYLINIIIMITFLSITYLFIASKNSYQELTNEYDSLFTYVQNFEDWIEKEQLNRHEYKNQLAVLRCLTKEKKVKEKIDEILEDNINIEGEIINQLKNLPKGGLKGLMYYKSAIAQKEKINLTITTSLESKTILKQLTEKEIRTLCKLIGIYYDNAIEAAKETKKKTILIEIYELKDNINFVFSNTYKQHKNFKDRNKKGVSSKGKGHGNGLYFAKKIIEENKWLSQKQDIIDKYYIQQLIITKKNT